MRHVCCSLCVRVLAWCTPMYCTLPNPRTLDGQRSKLHVLPSLASWRICRTVLRPCFSAHLGEARAQASARIMPGCAFPRCAIMPLRGHSSRSSHAVTTSPLLAAESRLCRPEIGSPDATANSPKPHPIASKAMTALQALQAAVQDEAQVKKECAIYGVISSLWAVISRRCTFWSPTPVMHTFLISDLPVKLRHWSALALGWFNVLQFAQQPNRPASFFFFFLFFWTRSPCTRCIRIDFVQRQISARPFLGSLSRVYWTLATSGSQPERGMGVVGVRLKLN